MSRSAWCLVTRVADTDEVLTWGLNLRGQLGNGLTKVATRRWHRLMVQNLERPVNIRKNLGVAGTLLTKIATGAFHNLALMST